MFSILEDTTYLGNIVNLNTIYRVIDYETYTVRSLKGCDIIKEIKEGLLYINVYDDSEDDELFTLADDTFMAFFEDSLNYGNKEIMTFNHVDDSTLELRFKQFGTVIKLSNIMKDNFVTVYLNKVPIFYVDATNESRFTVCLDITSIYIVSDNVLKITMSVTGDDDFGFIFMYFDLDTGYPFRIRYTNVRYNGVHDLPTGIYEVLYNYVPDVKIYSLMQWTSDKADKFQSYLAKCKLLGDTIVE